MQKLKIEDFILQKFSLRVEEVGKILNYLEQLLSEDIFYDRIKKVSNVPGEGFAFGLTVPDLQNYIGGFGGCGINHNTYPLPEAQQDRFLLKILVDYPSYEDEMKIVNIYTETVKPLKLKPMLNKAHILSLQELVRQVPIANDIKQRVVRIVQATRANKDIIHYGASPRASIGLILAAKAAALIEGRAHVSMADIEKIAYPVLRHRIILNFEAERKGMSTDDAVKEILKKVK